jgi:protein-disulfide isomerase
MKCILGTLLCLILNVPAVLAQQPPSSPNPANKSEIEQIVKDYIMKHPEVVLDSVRAYQERERAAQQQKAKDAIVTRQSELLRDPASPSTKPIADQPANEVTIVEFFDYRCGFCKKVNPTLLKFVADHPNVRLVFKEFPILGPESVVASKAALAAERQGKYLQFHQTMMASSAPVTTATVEQTGKDIGLDVNRMKADMESPEVAAVIAKNTELATALNVTATPTFVVGSEVYSGALDAAGFQNLIAKSQAKK